MSDSKARLLATLDVRRNALWGFGASTALTLAVLLFFVVIPGSVHPTPYYLALAFVLATSLGATLTVVLTVRTAKRVAAQSEESPPSGRSSATEQPPAGERTPGGEGPARGDQP